MREACQTSDEPRKGAPPSICPLPFRPFPYTGQGAVWHGNRAQVWGKSQQCQDLLLPSTVRPNTQPQTAHIWLGTVAVTSRLSSPFLFEPSSSGRQCSLRARPPRLLPLSMSFLLATHPSLLQVHSTLRVKTRMYEKETEQGKRKQYQTGYIRSGRPLSRLGECYSQFTVPKRVVSRSGIKKNQANCLVLCPGPKDGLVLPRASALPPPAEKRLPA